MTQDEIEAERERFFSAWMRSDKSFDLRFDHENQKFICWEVENHWWFSWMKRAEIARAEQAELRSENERLRERVRELASEALMLWFDEESERSAEFLWGFALVGEPEIVQLAEDAGWWLDNFGHRVPLAEWRERMGGVG